MFDFDKERNHHHAWQTDLRSDSVLTIDQTNGNNGSTGFVESTESYQRQTHHL